MCSLKREYINEERLKLLTNSYDFVVYKKANTPSTRLST